MALALRRALGDSEAVGKGWCLTAVALLGACGSGAASETSVLATHPITSATSLPTPTAAPSTVLPAPTAARTTTATAPPIVLGTPIPIDGAVPVHGFAYSTAAGVVVAPLDGSPRAHLAGYRVTDRSPETGRIVAVVTAADGTRYALVVGSATIAPIVSGAANESTPVYGWTVDDAHTGCLSDARRAGSPLRLCATSDERLPRSIRRARADGTLEPVADSPTTAIPGTGHWADAIASADGAVAATWSGDCESLTSFRMAPGQTVQQLVPGESAVLGWDGVDILVARFGGCGPATPDDGVYRVTPTGATTRVPLIDATEPPVAW